jgi:hypothetical protein
VIILEGTYVIGEGKILKNAKCISKCKVAFGVETK